VLNEIIIEHFRNPHNAGNLVEATATVEATNPACGDTMRLSVRLEGERIVEARFKMQGCVASIAAGSALTDLLIGHSLAESRQITPAKISEALGGLPPTTMHAAELAMDALTILLRQVQ
jgi:nitrogen fixation NifU-like protein